MTPNSDWWDRAKTPSPPERFPVRPRDLLATLRKGEHAVTLERRPIYGVEEELILRYWIPTGGGRRPLDTAAVYWRLPLWRPSSDFARRVGARMTEQRISDDMASCAAIRTRRRLS